MSEWALAAIARAVHCASFYSHSQRSERLASAIPSILDFLPHSPGSGCDPGPCTGDEQTPPIVGNAFANTGESRYDEYVRRCIKQTYDLNILDLAREQKKAPEFSAGVGFSGNPYPDGTF